MTRFRNFALVLTLAVIVGGAFYLFRDASVESAPTASPPVAVSAPAEPAKQLPSNENTKVVEARKAHATTGSGPFEFIRGLAKAAYDGDGRAQYLISRELDRCEMTLALVRRQAGDPETIIWSLPETGWTQPMKEGAIAELRRCIRLLKEDPFAGLPPREDGYTFQYWMDRAVESGYPLAVVERSLGDWSRQTDGGMHAEKPGASNQALSKLTTAAASGDPDVALTIGYRQSLYEGSVRKNSAYAWMLAGCRLGADCSTTSKVVPFWMCNDPSYPSCSVDGNVELSLSSSLSPSDYGDAYAQSQVIEETLRSRDPDAIRKQLEKLL